MPVDNHKRIKCATAPSLERKHITKGVEKKKDEKLESGWEPLARINDNRLIFFTVSSSDNDRPIEPSSIVIGSGVEDTSCLNGCY